MSVESMAIALHHSKARGAEKLVLIGIANHDGDGGAWPSMTTLAKYAGVTRDQARKLVARLEQRREVRRVVNGGGNRDVPEYLRPNLYEFVLRCPSDCDHSRNHRTKADQVVTAPQFLDEDPPTPEQVELEPFEALETALSSPQPHGGGAAQTPQPHGGGTPSRTEGQTVHKPNYKTNKETHVIAREEFAIEDPCPIRPWSPHAIDKHGFCIDCHTNPKTGETRYAEAQPQP